MEFPVVDSHFHFFDPKLLPGYKTFVLSDFQDVSKNVNIVSAIHMQYSKVRQAGKFIEETANCQSYAEQNQRGIPNALIVHVDLHEGPDVSARQIEQHLQISKNVRGIRHILSNAPLMSYMNDDPEACRKPQFRKAFALLDRYNLTFDVLIFGNQIPQITELAKEFPRVPIILNHFGWLVGIDPEKRDPSTSDWRDLIDLSPKQQEATFKRWKEDISELAKCPNVYMKISGLVMVTTLSGRAALAQNATTGEELAAIFLPYVSHTISTFGVDRCMWASNFPVDGLGGFDYTENFRGYKICFDKLNLSQVDQIKIFHDNALRVYNVKSKSKL